MLLGTTVNSTGWVGHVAITTAVPSCLLCTGVSLHFNLCFFYLIMWNNIFFNGYNITIILKELTFSVAYP